MTEGLRKIIKEEKLSEILEAGKIVNNKPWYLAAGKSKQF
uniref:Uncharacterized protein n=1 Tax=Trichinella nativa TaxID=6335 RepID=A0A0V1KHW2_9BILA